MSLYALIAIVIAISVFFRIRHGAKTIPYALAALLLVLFLYTPTRFFPGLGHDTALGPPSALESVERLGEVVSYALLVLAAWISGTVGRPE